MIIKAKNVITWKEKIIGNIGKKEITPLYFETRWGIHTFGMREPIDIVILDAKNRVWKIKVSLKPNRIFLWNPKYKKVIELKSGTIKNLDIQPQKTVVSLKI